LGLKPLTQGTRRFTTPGPLRRIVIGAYFRGGAFALPAAWAFSSHDDDAIEPLTPLSPLSSGPGERTFVRIFRAGESRQDRFHRAPVMRLGLVGPRYLPSIRTLRMVQSPLQRWARDRSTAFWEMIRPLHGACHTMRGLGRSCSVSPPQPDSRRFFTRTSTSRIPLRRCAKNNFELGHRSLAPATFFEVRFAGLFEARRRLSTSAT
jgi:hypothetical protein